MDFNKFNNQTRIVSNLKRPEQGQLGRMTVEQVKQGMNNAKNGFKEQTRQIAEEQDHLVIQQTNYGAKKDFKQTVDAQKQIMRGFNNR